MSESSFNDLKIRRRALEPSGSFIVQAPAGSGKTSLLVERYLTLLLYVNNPEEILALTFTRKAAYEMQKRILDLLTNLPQQIIPPNIHIANLQKLAIRVMEQDAKNKWHLLDNPNLLRIQTIDSFCYSIATQAPLTTGIGLQGTIIQNQEALFYYHRAAKEVLKNITEPEYQKPLGCLLLHLDNDWERVANLLVVMLKSREQWLPHVVVLKNAVMRREAMEKGLARISGEACAACNKCFPPHLYQELRALFKIAHETLDAGLDFFVDIIRAHNLSGLQLDTWQDLARLLLTKEYMWRKTITKEHGFPAPTKNDPQKKLMHDTKVRMQNLLAELANHPHLRQGLENILLVPPHKYSEPTWELIASLLELLPLLVAHLKLIFAENNLTDHSEIAQKAEALLGDAEEPTNLALNLDYRIKHLLIDEFQDTSLAQFRLLEKLITTWQAGDGHSFFAVGDPMQSIYRFREAEVGLFLRVIEHGIANLCPQLLTLSTNFRATRHLVTWINTNFNEILPKTADISLGAIPFTTACGTFDYKRSAVRINLYANSDPSYEGEKVIEMIQEIRDTTPKETIAILVRSRNHLTQILPKLRNAGLSYQASELETLLENTLICDLYTLTRALFDLSDRIAWLALLRAPWCGLTLSDLHKIANAPNSYLIWEVISDMTSLALSRDGSKRLQRLYEALTPFVERCRRVSWRELIAGAWMAIGGPATAADNAEIELVETYWTLLNEPLDIGLLQQKLMATYVSSTVSAACSLDTDTTAIQDIQVMTIHKAKGLEFDHVIIPGITRSIRSDDRKLLLWLERPRPDRGSDLILAPLTSSNNHNEQIYKYLQMVERQKSMYETGRLLYVAMTRAKKNIYLTGSFISANGKDGEVVFPHNSFIEQLKPCYSDTWLIKTKNHVSCPIPSPRMPMPLMRLSSAWHAPLFTYPVDSLQDPPQFNLTDDTQQQIIGTVIHFCLYKLATIAPYMREQNYLLKQVPYWRKLLLQHGYLDINGGLTLIQKAVDTTLNDERGRWILDPHLEGACELALTKKVGNKFYNYVLDRTFVTRDSIRWIIDYKTSLPTQEIQEAAALQLKEYASLFVKSIPNLPIKLGVYFPLCGKWCEIDIN